MIFQKITQTIFLSLAFCILFFGNVKKLQASNDFKTTETITISGKITDDKGEPLIGATLVLQDFASKQMVKGEVSDENGNFIFENILAGKYELAIQYIGFAATTKELPEIKSGEHYEMETIIMTSEGTTLDEVTVRSKIPFIEKKLDRLIVNVESGIIAAGSSAFDVLQRSPGIVVNQNDAISLRGKQGVIIMIDGKPS